ncbi:hypothetical protein [Flavobacterium sp. RSP15]|uniref:hypothetical protein n=1 Tax=Flavobacterium sp. RSP15 TaxID=2497485 RepID=UPI001F41BADD
MISMTAINYDTCQMEGFDSLRIKKYYIYRHHPNLICYWVAEKECTENDSEFLLNAFILKNNKIINPLKRPIKC